MSLDSSTDPEINAALSGEDLSPPAAATSDDPEIQAAMVSEPMGARKGKRVDLATESILGPLELAGTSVANLPHAALHGAVDLYRRLASIKDGDYDEAKPDPEFIRNMEVAPGPAGKQLASDIAGAFPRNDAATTQPDETNVPVFGDTTQDVLRHTFGVAGDVGALTAAGGALKSVPKLLASGAPEVLPTAQEVVNRGATSQSMGAAGTGIDVSAASPEEQRGIVAHGETGPINPDVLERRVRASRQGIDLTEGQATRDSQLYSDEINNRKQAPQIGERLADQTPQLVNRIDQIRREASPTSVQNGPVEHGQTMVDKYKIYDEPIKADITAKYKALADANGGDLPVDGNSYVDAADAALKQANKARYLPPEIRGTLDDLRDGGNFTFNNFENLRTDLAAAVRKADRAGDGNAKAAINIARNQLEQLPMTGEATKLKPLADAARNAARARFEAQEADPAYAAAVEDAATTKAGQSSAIADKFMDKYVTGANVPNADVAKIQEKFGNDSDVQEAIKGHVLNTLKEKAGVNSQNVGFHQHGYNSTLDTLDKKRKLDLLLGPDVAQQARDLGNTAQDIQVRPEAHTVVNSNSSLDLRNAGTKLAEHAIQANTAGLGMPILRSIFPDKSAAEMAERALKPGAGLNYPQKSKITNRP